MTSRSKADKAPQVDAVQYAENTELMAISEGQIATKSDRLWDGAWRFRSFGSALPPSDYDQLHNNAVIIQPHIGENNLVPYIVVTREAL